MTRTQSGANWSGVPSLSQLLLAALLRLVAMFVVGAAASLRMLLTLLSRECHTGVERDRLPAMESGLSEKAKPAAPPSQTTEALMVSSSRSERPSNHEGGLTVSLNESFSGKARSAASRESRFERHGNRQSTLQFPPSTNRDSRDALRLPGNDRGWGWKLTLRPRP